MDHAERMNKELSSQIKSLKEKAEEDKLNF